MLFFSPSQTNIFLFFLSPSVFLRLSFCVSIIILLHLVPSDAVSFSASPSPSPLPLHLSPSSLFIGLRLLLLPACFISSPPPPRCPPVAASVGGMLKSAASLCWMKSNMTGPRTVAGRQMYFLEFTSRNDTLSFRLAVV